MTTYCEYVLMHPEDSFNKSYHDTEYGFPLDDDNLLFERFIFEINQAGLSWITILKKAEGFRRAYHGFDIAEIAAYSEADRERLLADEVVVPAVFELQPDEAQREHRGRGRAPRPFRRRGGRPNAGSERSEGRSLSGDRRHRQRPGNSASLG